MIKHELDTIPADGYSYILLGDLKGHLGSHSRGIPNNHANIDFNGSLLRDFVDLKLINADPLICTGFFTRIVSNSRTVLDYVLEDKNNHLIKNMVIDHSGHLDSIKHQLQTREYIQNPTGKTSKIFQSNLDAALQDIIWDMLTLNQKCEALQGAFMEAASHLPQ